jgi:hypothetical protein
MACTDDLLGIALTYWLPHNRARALLSARAIRSTALEDGQVKDYKRSADEPAVTRLMATLAKTVAS